MVELDGPLPRLFTVAFTVKYWRGVGLLLLTVKELTTRSGAGELPTVTEMETASEQLFVVSVSPDTASTQVP